MSNLGLGQSARTLNDNSKTNLLNASKTNLSGFTKPKNLTRGGLTPYFEEPGENDTKPLFIADFPTDNDKGLTIFDFYFNLDNNQWMPFKLSDSINATLMLY